MVRRRGSAAGMRPRAPSASASLNCSCSASPLPDTISSDAAQRADRADAHHLVGGIGQAITLDQRRGARGSASCVYCLSSSSTPRMELRPRRRVRMIEPRRLVLDAWARVPPLCAMSIERSAAMREEAIGLAQAGAASRPIESHDLVVVEHQAAIPGLEHRRCGEHGHRLAIARGRRSGRGRGGFPCRRCRSVATTKLAARRLRSHSQGATAVSSKSLMSKHEAALGRGEAAEIEAMAVACRLHHQAVRRCRGEIGGHDRRQPRRKAKGEAFMRA